jgi:hypothetical protein
MMNSMKLLIVLILCLWGRIALTQSYVHFPDTVAMWHETYIQQIPPPILWYDAIGEIYYKGDTTINNITYHKLYSTQRNIFCSQVIEGTPYYTGALREDTIQQRMYYRESGQDTEHILYDFSLEVGDTLPGHSSTVKSIDTIITDDGIARRRWHVFADYPEAYYIEGIGGNQGLLTDVLGVEYPNVTLCFGGDTKQIVYYNEYFTYGNGDCHVPTDTCWNVGMPEMQEISANFKVYPNPAKDYIVFECKGLQAKQQNQNSIQILNVLGQVVETLAINGDKTIWITEGVEPGVYFYKTTSGEYSGKVVIK